MDAVEGDFDRPGTVEAALEGCDHLFLRYGMTGDGAAGFPGHAAAVYELTGPEAITMPQAAAQLSEVVGRPVAYVDLPAEQFRARLDGAGLPDRLADSLVGLYAAIRAGHAATVTNHVEQLTGRPARRYREFAEANKGAFAA